VSASPAPNDSRIILTHTNDEVRALNAAARDRLRANGELGIDIRLQVERGERTFATGDRVMFLRNDRALDVKNGSIGTMRTGQPALHARASRHGRSIAFDLKDYAHIDHGYAATIHKSQGVTVDRTHVLATPGMDQHSSYVALSRHRDSVQLHYGRDDFANDGNLARTLSRERAKDMASDYGRDEGMERRFAERRGITFRAAGGGAGPEGRAREGCATCSKLYRSGRYSASKDCRYAMAEMAKGLERDPQMESILRNRKLELGISVESTRSSG
jgi:hypothetical protein